MNGPHTKPSRSVSPQAFSFGAGQSGTQGRGCYFENSNGAQVPPHQGTGIETEQAQEHTQGLFSCGGHQLHSFVAVGQGASTSNVSFAKGLNYLTQMPFMRKVSVILSLIAIFSIAFHSGKWIFKEPPEDLFASAQASEKIQTNQKAKTDQLGFFLQDCY